MDNAVEFHRFNEFNGAHDKHCFFEFILYYFNGKIIDKFDIDFGRYNDFNCIPGVRDDIMNLNNFKNHLTLKDNTKYIFSNNKNNNKIFASREIYISLSQNIFLKKIIISTKDTVVGLKQNHHGHYVDVKPNKFWIKLLSLQNEKMEILQEFNAKCNSDYTCVIHNYEAYKITGTSLSLSSKIREILL